MIKELKNMEIRENIRDIWVNTKKMIKKSKYYYDKDRNIDYNKKSSTPDYYKGKVYGYKAFDIIEDYNLSYNCASALAYIIRNRNKHKYPIECLQKAIDHLSNEIDCLNRNQQQ
jgi:hypothetical protein